MKVGMLWLDTDGSGDLGLRLEAAARYYQEKYGRRARLCIVHPETAGERPPQAVADMAIRVRTDVLRRHFWIGDGEAGRNPN